MSESAPTNPTNPADESHDEAAPVHVHREPLVVPQGPQDLKGVEAFGKVFAWIMFGGFVLFVFILVRFNMQSQDALDLYQQEKKAAAESAEPAPQPMPAPKPQGNP